MPKTKAKKAADDPSKPQPQPFPLGMDTTIEEDVIAVPRVSRKRGGDFDDFEGEEDNEAPPNKSAKSISAPRVSRKRDGDVDDLEGEKDNEAPPNKSAKSISAPRVSRKRGGDVDDLEGEKDNDEALPGKSAKSIPAPRASRTRGDDLGDFEGQEDNNEALPKKSVKSKAEKSKKIPKVSSAKKASADSTLPQPQPFPKGMDTTIEEDVVFAPRESRKRGGDFDDMEGQENNDEAPSNKTATSKAGKPKKNPKVSIEQKASAESTLPQPQPFPKGMDTTIEEDVVFAPRESRKRGGDFDDFEDQAGNDEASSRKSAKTKAEKPKQKPKTSSAGGETVKTGKAGGHTVETEKTLPGGDRVEVDTTEAPKPKQGKGAKGKRSDAVMEDVAESAAKEPKPKRTKKDVGKPGPSLKSDASTASTAKPAAKEAKPKKAKKDEGKSGPTSKSDASTAETAKLTVKEAKPKKAKKDEGKSGPTPKSDASTADTAKPAEKEVKPRKSKKAENGLMPQDNAPEVAKTVEKVSKSKKTKISVNESVADTRTDAPDKPKAGPGRPKKPAALEANDKPKKGKAAAPGANDKPKKGKAAAPEAKEKSKKEKAVAMKDTTVHDDAGPAPELTMDEGPFNALLDSNKGNPSEVNEGEEEEPQNRSKRGRKPKAGMDGVEALAKTPRAPTIGKAEDTKKLRDDQQKEKGKKGKATDSAQTKTEADATNLKKRKAPASAVVDTLKTDVLDPLAEHASSKKKQKKSKSTLGAAGDKLEELLTSGLDVATQGADTLKTDVLEPLAEHASPKKKLEQSKNSLEAAGDKLGELYTSGLDVATQGVDTLMTDVLEPLAEHASPKKKLKQSKTSLEAAGDKLGELLTSGLDAATQSANAAKEYITDAATGAQKSIMGDVTEVAEAVVDAQEAAKTLKDKGKGKAKEEDVSNSSKVPTFDGADESDEGATGEDGVEGDESDFEEDDQTLALIRGFESDEEPEVATDGGKGFEPGQELPGLPEGKQIPKKLKNIKSTDDGPGVVYVGRIPHGFYEHQMRQYFSQFGPIARLRLSRNKRTGASRHYAFLEFESASVAKIVAETMNNYLMFGHILKTNLVTKEQLHEDIWKGADKRFKKVPWNKIEGRKLSAGVGREEWSKRIERESDKRAKKGEKLREIGYEFEGAPLKGIDTVPVKESKTVARTISETVFGESAEGLAVEEEEKTVIVSPPHGDTTMVVSEEIIVTKVKKGGKSKAKADDEEGVAAAATKSAVTVAKKAKRKSEDGAGAVANQAKKLKKSA